jgi:hypothetical protein
MIMSAVGMGFQIGTERLEVGTPDTRTIEGEIVILKMGPINGAGEGAMLGMKTTQAMVDREGR